MRVLLDASIDFETLDQVKRILEGHPMVVKVTSLIGRNAGRFRFLQTSIILRTGDLAESTPDQPNPGRGDSPEESRM